MWILNAMVRPCGQAMHRGADKERRNAGKIAMTQRSEWPARCVIKMQGSHTYLGCLRH